MRKESEQLFLDFFNEPENSVLRQRPGIYSAYTFGRKGQTCQIILLDTRYFRDPIPKAKYKKGERPKNIVGWYKPTIDTNMTLLGDAQWQWLEQQLAGARGLPHHRQQYPDACRWRKAWRSWGNVPHEQQRLFTSAERIQSQPDVGDFGGRSLRGSVQN